jgi:regulator of telomere elongation helicase 1
LAEKMLICPYFGSKDRIHGADLVFMPYNYLIDEKIRENFEVQYKGSCIIFDEAHNASSTAEDVVSFEIVGKTLELAMSEIERL